MKKIVTNTAIILILFAVNFNLSAQYYKYKTEFKGVNKVAKSKPTFENVRVYRLQLRFKTSNLKNANTDNAVGVVLNEKDYPFYLNLSKDDREKGKIDTYDIHSVSIKQIKDIKQIQVFITNSDAWNIKHMELLVNNIVIYKKVFSGKEGWIDSYSSKHKGSINISSRELRNTTNWRYNNRTKTIYQLPSVVPVRMIKSQVESMVGNTLHNMYGFTWGKKYGAEYVSIKRLNHNTLHVDLDLKQEGDLSSLTDSETDVDFDIKFQCVNGKLKAKIMNMTVDFSGTGNLNFAKREFKEDLKGNFRFDYKNEKLGLSNLEDVYNYNNNTQNVCKNGFDLLDNGDLQFNKKRKISKRVNKID